MFDVVSRSGSGVFGNIGGDLSFTGIVESIGKILSEIFRNPYATMAVLFVIGVVALYAIFHNMLKKVNIFGESRQTAILAWCLSLLSNIGFLFWRYDTARRIRDLDHVIHPYIVFAIVALVLALISAIKKR